MVIRLDPRKRQVAEPVIKFVPRKKRLLTIEGNNGDDDNNADLERLLPLTIEKPNSKEPHKASNYLSEEFFPENKNENPKQAKKWSEKDLNEMTPRDWAAMKADLQIKSKSDLKPLLKWTQLHLPSTLQKILLDKYPTPTPIQRATVSLVQNGLDCIGIAPTGSGKTLAFVLPFVINSNLKTGLVLAPTRELAMQTLECVNLIGKSRVDCLALIGGHDILEQQQKLNELSDNQKIFVATPGRLIDVVERGSLKLDNVDYLVLDEADRMLDLGFEEQLTKIREMLPIEKRQTLLFSATWPPQVKEFSHNFTQNAVEVQVESAKKQITQDFLFVDSQSSRFGLLLKQLKNSNLSIVFVDTKNAVDSIVDQLTEAGIKVAGLHGGMSQDGRENSLQKFKSQKVHVLVATDVAARGVDVPNVSLVVNFDMPNYIETYIHRIGRTGRANMKGRSLSLITDEDRPMFPELRKHLRSSGNKIPTFMLQ